MRCRSAQTIAIPSTAFERGRVLTPRGQYLRARRRGGKSDARAFVRSATVWEIAQRPKERGALAARCWKLFPTVQATR
jgi:hypothetical protein